MSRYFNKLAGFSRSPAGLESRLLALAPRCLLYGTLLLASPLCACGGCKCGYGPAALARNKPAWWISWPSAG